MRVLPRDAFNDANLLKCIGKLTLAIEFDHAEITGLSYEYDGEPFNIIMCDDGDTYVSNIRFYYGDGDNKIELLHSRPLNSRDAWPLYLQDTEGDPLEVFNDNGDIVIIENLSHIK